MVLLEFPAEEQAVSDIVITKERSTASFCFMLRSFIFVVDF